MFLETNQSLLSWKVSQPLSYAKKESARSCSQLQQRVSLELLVVKASLTLTKEAIVLILIALAGMKFWDEFHSL